MPSKERELLAQQLANLPGKVKLEYFHQTESSVQIPGRRPCPSCAPTKAVLEEIAGLSEQIELTVHEFSESKELAAKHQIERVPGILIRGEINRPVRIIGMPGGVLMALLVQAIQLCASDPPDPPAKVKSTLKKLRKKTHLRVVGSMMDPATGDAALLTTALALLSNKLEVTVYNLDEFPDLGAQLGLDRVPATVVGDRHGFAGVASIEELVRFLYDLEAHPDRASLQPPQVAEGSARPWAPPQPPPSPGQGPPGPPGPGRRGPGPPGRGPRGGGPRGGGPPAGTPPGMRRTESGLVVPNR